jgi:hypothetical protein
VGRSVLIALLLLAACRAKGEATVDGVLLAQADGVEPADPRADSVTLPVDAAGVGRVAVPRERQVRLAIGREVPWMKVQELLDRVKAAGSRAVILVGRAYHVQGFRIEDPPWPAGVEGAIRVIVYADGKACVQPPGSPEAKCVQSVASAHVERAFVRELVREQVKLFNLPRVEVELPATLSWADVVRAIDGGRTCCFETKVSVHLAAPAPAP